MGDGHIRECNGIPVNVVERGGVIGVGDEVVAAFVVDIEGADWLITMYPVHLGWSWRPLAFCGHGRWKGAGRGDVNLV